MWIVEVLSIIYWLIIKCESNGFEKRDRKWYF